MNKPLLIAASATWFSRTKALTRENIQEMILTDAQQMLDDGFDAVELPLPLAGGLMEELPATFWGEIAQQLREIGIPATSVHGPNWPSLQVPVAEARSMLRPYALACVAMGVRALVAHPTHHSHPHVCAVLPSLLERDIELTKFVSDQLGSSGCRLAIENLPTYGLAYLTELMRRVQLSNVGVCFDTGHYHLRPEHDLQTAIAPWRDRIVHLHLTDNHGLCDEHLAPGLGTFDYALLSRVLPAEISCRQAPLLIELGPPILASDADALAKTREIHQRSSRVARETLLRAGWSTSA